MKPWALVVQCVDRPRLLPVVLDVDSGAFVGALRAVDLDVALELNGNADALDVRTECDIDYTWPRVALAASLNYVCFLFALYQCGRRRRRDTRPVSYTHLTLPTKRIV